MVPVNRLHCCLMVIVIVNLKPKIFHFKTTITTMIGDLSYIGEFFLSIF